LRAIAARCERMHARPPRIPAASPPSVRRLPVSRTLPAGRRRESHGRRPGHRRRCTTTRAGPGDSDPPDPPSRPAGRPNARHLRGAA
jgi:hypothetical protein